MRDEKLGGGGGSQGSESSFHLDLITQLGPPLGHLGWQGDRNHLGHWFMLPHLLCVYPYLYSLPLCLKWEDRISHIEETQGKKIPVRTS